MPPKKSTNNNPVVNKKAKKRASSRKNLTKPITAKLIEVSDSEPVIQPSPTEKPADKIYWEKDLSRTDRLLDWLENNPSDRQKLFSDSAQDAKEENRARRVARGAKSEFYIKIAIYVFSVDADEQARKEVESNVNKYAKAVENRLGSLKVKYREFNKKLGSTGSGLTVADIREDPVLSNMIDGLRAKFPCWERLHGFWRTLPSYNPHSVSSEPGQNLVREAQQLMYQKGSEESSTNNVNTEEVRFDQMSDDGSGEHEIGESEIKDIPDLAKRDTVIFGTSSSHEPSLLSSPNEDSVKSGFQMAGDIKDEIHKFKQMSYIPSKLSARLYDTSTTVSSSSISSSTPKSHVTTGGKRASTHKVSASTKRPRIDSLAAFAETDTNKLIEITVAQQEYKVKALDVKRQKYAVEGDRERYAAEDRATAARERIMKEEHQREQEKEEHERKMMQYRIQLFQLQQQSSTSSRSILTSPNHHTLYSDITSTATGNPATGCDSFQFHIDEGVTSFPHTTGGQSSYLPNTFDIHQRF